MKTSNKLLLGLFVFVIICILIVNFAFKKQSDTVVKSNAKTEVNSQDSVAAFNSDSVAMDKAIGNE
jgi:hypothetical protein